MPATAGRVRMPHNNRVSTSGALKTSDIWSKTIGHDPYAAEAEKQQAAAAADNEAKARSLMELARHQNVSGRDGSRDDFARKMYLGLKPGKKRRSDTGESQSNDGKAYELLEQDTSSSEEEFVEVEEPVEKSEKESSKKKSSRKERKRKDRKRRRKRHSSSSDDDSSSDESRRRERRRKRRSRKDKKKRRRKHRRSSHDSSSEESD